MEKIIPISIAAMALAAVTIALTTITHDDCCCQNQIIDGPAMYDSVVVVPGDTIVLVPGDSIMRLRSGLTTLVVGPGRKGLLYAGTP